MIGLKTVSISFVFQSVLMHLELSDCSGTHLVGAHEIHLHYSLDLLQAVAGEYRNLRYSAICLGQPYSPAKGMVSFWGGNFLRL